MLLVSLLLVIEGIIRLAEIFNRQTCKAKHLSKNILLKYGKLSVKFDSVTVHTRGRNRNTQTRI